MPLTPQITLTITLNDLQGNAIGSAGSPAYVRVALCNYGQFLPRVPGTTMIGKIGPYLIPYVGVPITIELWGNDVILPAGTYYTISILDDAKNVLQTGAYPFEGTVNQDLSTISPTFPSYVPSVLGGEVFIPFSATPQFDCALVNGPVVFSLLLTGPVTGPTLVAPLAGQIVIFKIVQDGVGGHAFTWPGNVLNAGIVDAAAGSTTTQAFFADATGNLYPMGSQTYS